MRLRAVVEEHVLDRLAGGPSVMRPQLKHLLESMRRENVEVRIYIQDQVQVAAYALSMGRLCSVALSVPDSIDAVKARIAALDAISED